MPANYNTTTNMPPQCEGTKLVPRTGIIERIATNGAVRVRALQSADKLDPVVDHGTVTLTQLNAFKTFYSTNRTTPFYFTAIEDGVQRTCLFRADRPYDVTPQPGPGGVILSKLVVNMREV